MPSGRWPAQDRQPRAAARSRRARAARPSTAPFSYLRVVHWVTTLSLSLRSQSLSNCSGSVLRLFFALSCLRPLWHLTHPLGRRISHLSGSHRRDGVNTYGESDLNILAIIEHSFYGVGYALG